MARARLSPAYAPPRYPDILRLRHLQVPAILLFVVVGFYWRLLLTNQYTWLHGPDFANQVLPWYQFEAGEFHKLRIPLWDPYEWAGQSIIGQGQPGVADPLNLPMFLWPLRRGWISQGALHWFYVLPHWIAALGFYALCRELARSKLASMIGACLYTLGGLGSSLDWPQMNHATVWGPVALLFVFRAGNGKSPLASGVLSGFFLGLAWLSGHHQIPIYFTLTTVAFWIYFFVVEKDRRWQITQAAAAAMILMFLVSAVQTLPALEYGRSARRFVGAEEALKWNETVPYYVHDTFSMSPLSMLGIVLPGFDTSYPPHLGFTAVLLGLFGMVTTWADRSTRWLTAIAAGGLFYSLGSHTIVQGLFYALMPMIEKARVPAIAQIIFDMGICGMAAAGIDQLNKVEWALWRKRLAWTFGGIGLVMMSTACVYTLMKIVWPGAEDRWMMSGWIAIACWVVLRRNTKHAVLWLAFLALTEISITTVRSWANNDWKERSRLLDNMASHDDIATFVRSKPGAPRMSFVLDDIPYSFGDFWGIETIEAMVPSVPEELWRNDVWSRRTNQLLGVRYYASKKPRFAELTRLFDSKSGIPVWIDPEALPRLWQVHKVSSVKDLVEAVKMLQDPHLDMRKEALVIGKAPPLESCEGGSETYIKRVPNRLTIEAEMVCRGMVIVDDLYDRNWTAEVDGVPAGVHEAYALVRGVVVEKGSHRVELIYRPRSVYAGAFLSVFGILVALIACTPYVRQNRALKSRDRKGAGLPLVRLGPLPYGRGSEEEEQP